VSETVFLSYSSTAKVFVPFKRSGANFTRKYNNEGYDSVSKIGQHIWNGEVKTLVSSRRGLFGYGVLQRQKTQIY